MFKAIKLNSITVNMAFNIIDYIVTSTSVPVTVGTSFALSAFVSSAAYLSVFDQYKFDHLETWLEPQGSISQPISNWGTLTSCIDLDDGSTPSFADVEDHQTSLSTSGQDSHYHAWKPHMAVAVYSGAFTSFANEPADWIDSGSPNVQHYGQKCAVSIQSASTKYNLYIRARVSFRQPGL